MTLPSGSSEPNNDRRGPDFNPVWSAPSAGSQVAASAPEPVHPVVQDVAAAAPSGPALPLAAPSSQRPVRRRSSLRWALVTFCMLAVFGVNLSIIGVDVGASGLVVGLALAACTAAVALAVLLWVDRQEPEPTQWLSFALLWGGSFAIFGALFLNTWGTGVLMAWGLSEDAGAVFVAPWVEETLKAMGVVAIIVAQRDEFDGFVDSVVYSSMVAIGFAAVENVQYFGVALAHGGVAELSATFFARGVLSPFAHPLFTAPVGIALGMAAYHRSWGWKLLVPVAFFVSVAGHALWNYLAVSGDFLLGYVFIMVPIFLGLAGLVVFFRVREERLIRQSLVQFVNAGWFGDTEISYFATKGTRRAALAWAKRQLPQAEYRVVKAVRGQMADVSVLRHRLNRGTVPPQAARRELVLLESIVKARPFVAAALAATKGSDVTTS